MLVVPKVCSADPKGSVNSFQGISGYIFVKDNFKSTYFLHFRRGKGTRNAIGMTRIILERTLETDEELCVCFIDWQKAFDRVNWTKLMQILKRTGIDRRERRLISKLYMDQRVKVRLDRGETRSTKIGRGVR